MVHKVMQEILHSDDGENGDCYRASVASLLGLPLEEVPHFYRKGNEERAMEEFSDWLRERGYVFVDIMRGENLPAYLKGTFHLLSGPSPRFPQYWHCVLGYEGEIYHDPHPEGGSLGGIPQDWIVTVLVAHEPTATAGWASVKPEVPDEADAQ